MVDYQFLGLAAVVFAVLTGGSLLPMAAMTAVVVLALVAYEAAARRARRRHHIQPGAPTTAADPAPLSDGELARWMTVVDRVLRTKD